VRLEEKNQERFWEWASSARIQGTPSAAAAHAALQYIFRCARHRPCASKWSLVPGRTHKHTHRSPCACVLPEPDLARCRCSRPPRPARPACLSVFQTGEEDGARCNTIQRRDGGGGSRRGSLRGACEDLAEEGEHTAGCAQLPPLRVGGRGWGQAASLGAIKPALDPCERGASSCSTRPASEPTDLPVRRDRRSSPRKR
jgi:hypothetical protein